MTIYHLAQLNIATMREPLESPSMADFVANLERINGLADASPGFVWRLKDDTGDAATAIRPLGEDILVNMSVWESVESLHQFAFRTAHAEIMRRRHRDCRTCGSMALRRMRSLFELRSRNRTRSARALAAAMTMRVQLPDYMVERHA